MYKAHTHKYGRFSPGQEYYFRISDIDIRHCQADSTCPVAEYGKDREGIYTRPRTRLVGTFREWGTWKDHPEYMEWHLETATDPNAIHWVRHLHQHIDQ